jgi:hypothetical protein
MRIKCMYLNNNILILSEWSSFYENFIRVNFLDISEPIKFAFYPVS